MVAPELPVSPSSLASCGSPLATPSLAVPSQASSSSPEATHGLAATPSQKALPTGTLAAHLSQTAPPSQASPPSPAAAQSPPAPPSPAAPLSPAVPLSSGDAPKPVMPEIVYHPHLGCRMYSRRDIKPAVVGRFGQSRGMVGEGAFAQVTAVRLPDNTVAAAKVLQAHDSEGPLWQEIIAVAAVGEHPSFPMLYGVVEQKPIRTMLYEFVGDKNTLSVTTLQDALDWTGTPSALSRKTWLRIVRNVCEGLLHMHNVDYVHCDIKADNILLFDVNDGKKTRRYAKIIDLGNACLEVAGPWLRIPEHLINQMYLECPQMAPEVMEGDSPFNKPAEVYALGDLLIKIGKAAGIRRLRCVGKKCQHADFRKRPTMAGICKKMSKHWK
ncbi:putative serine/threonine-protein kinase [Patiria miniata]|uniref:Protein kinase domain-containing protein n=1 Tax=Patiria miniata TaxID=46514 RepID=A0A913Z827_PATMI|nr:putative serine/threonine-protein kinase [Patiria miniata]